MQVKTFILSLVCILSNNALFAGYDETELQKLFTDKQQRRQIDSARSGNYSINESPQTNKVEVTGYVTRSDGKSVVWVNNKNTMESSRMGDVRIHQSSIGKGKKVTVTVDGNAVRLKPGETWSEDSGISDVID
ncbi:MAG: hypothetical protein GQ572_03220 [Gammaproteobacteria bacterium]|jgi:hypothetical protein|nr:hypothetical protein [Gammaproteobacteria bacterium]